MDKYPHAVSKLAQLLLSCMSDLVLLLDYGLQWVCRAVHVSMTSSAFP